jgi:hypothetical protein
VALVPATGAPTQPILVGSSSSRHRREEHHDAEAPRQEDAQATRRRAHVGADLARAGFLFGGGCLSFTDTLRRVMWPCKFRPSTPSKYDGSTDPREFLQVYTMAMEITEGRDPHVMANWFPLALKAPTSDWLLRFPRSSMCSWEDLCEQFINAFQGGHKRWEP